VDVSLQSGTATARGLSVSDTLIGITDVEVSGDDNLVTTSTVGGDTLTALDGNDNILIATGSGNVLTADSGNDTLIASGSGNLLHAGAGVELLTAIGTGNTLIGGNGGATLESDGGGNTLEAGVQAPAANQALYAGNEMNVNLVAGSATVNGSAVSDTLIGFTSATVSGNDDTLVAASNTGSIALLGTEDTLVVSQPASFMGTIRGLVDGDVIDLQNTDAVSASMTGSALSVVTNTNQQLEYKISDIEPLISIWLLGRASNLC